jgi:hypothetical protein
VSDESHRSLLKVDMSDVESRLILYFPTSNASYEVEPSDEILAGLSDLCDINLRRFFGGPRIHTLSRAHFKLIYHEGSGYILVDLFSASGTRVNNHQLPPGVQYLLRNGDFIMLAGNEDFVISMVTDVSKATEVFGDIQPSGSAGGPLARGRWVALHSWPRSVRGGWRVCVALAAFTAGTQPAAPSLQPRRPRL